MLKIVRFLNKGRVDSFVKKRKQKPTTNIKNKKNTGMKT